MNKSPKTRVLLLGVSSLCMLTLPQFAFANTTNNDLFPLTPRISGLGLAGTDEVVAGDAMAALAGNENGIWWLDGQGKTAFESAWVGSLGTGFRVAQGDKRILGAYVFGDRNISGSNTDFWFVSPGVESLGQVFDFRVNGYIPVSNQRKLTGTGFADTFGNYDYVTFQGHQQLDAIVDNYEMTGWGIDGEAGVKVPGWHGTRVYVGGYHFDQDQADSINGVAARVEYPINAQLALNVRDSYDNTQHNTIEVGLQVNLGGVNKNPRERDQAIRERMLDPVSRNLATLGQGTAEPIGNEQVLVNPGQPLEVERDNIWFFSPNANGLFIDGTSCTAENVCNSSQLTQTTISAINFGPTGATIDPSDPSFYLAPGNYNFTTSGTPYTLTDDSFYGRSADFAEPEQAAVLEGAAILKGTDIFDHIIFHNDPNYSQTVALTLNPDSHVTLNDSFIGADNSTQGYATAIKMTDATLIAQNNSQIHAFTDDPNVEAVGIDTDDTTASTINLTDSVVKSTADLSAAPEFLYSVYGIRTVNASGTNITLNNSHIEVAIDTGDLVVPTEIAANGIEVFQLGGSDNGTITLNDNSTINVSTNGNSYNLTANGIYVPLGNNITINLNDSEVAADVQGTATSTSNAIGIAMTTANASINMFNSEILANNYATSGAAANANGMNINAAGDVNVFMDNSTINSIADTDGSSFAAGMQVFNSSATGNNSVNLINSSHITTMATGGLNTNALGIQLVGGDQATVTLKDISTITTTATGIGASPFVESIGIIVDAANNTAITLEGASTVTANSILNSTNSFSATATGIQIQSYWDNAVNTVNINGGSSVNANATGDNLASAQANSVYFFNSFGSTGVTNTVTLTNAFLNAVTTVGTAGSSYSTFGASNVQIVDNYSDNTVTSTNSILDAATTLTNADSAATLILTTTSIYMPTTFNSPGANNTVNISGGTLTTNATVTNGGSADLNITNANVLLSNVDGDNSTTITNAVLNDTATITNGSSSNNTVNIFGVESKISGVGSNSVAINNGTAINLTAEIGGINPATLFMYGSDQLGGAIASANNAIFAPTVIGTWSDLHVAPQNP